MPLDKLRYFKTAAEERSLTRAAQKLGVSQQALSSAVAKLEEHYRARFFERRRTGLVLTPEGQHFYNYATAMLKREVRLSDELNEIRLRYTGAIRLGTTMTRSMTILPEALTQFAAEHPKIRLNMYISTHRFELEQKLVENELDVIVTPLDAALPATVRTAVLEEGWFCMTLPRSAVETILPPGQTIRSFMQLPLRAPREQVLGSGLLERIPCVFSSSRASRSGRAFLARHAPHNASIISFADYENLLSLPYCKFAAVFTYDTLARLNVAVEDGVPDHFIYYIKAPESPRVVLLCSPEKTINPAVPLLVRTLLDFAQKRRTPPPEEFFASLD